MTLSYRLVDLISFTLFSYLQSAGDGLIGFFGWRNEIAASICSLLHLAAVAMGLFSRYKDSAGWRLARRFLVNVLSAGPTIPRPAHPDGTTRIHTPPLYKNYAITTLLLRFLTFVYQSLNDTKRWVLARDIAHSRHGFSDT